MRACHDAEVRRALESRRAALARETAPQGWSLKLAIGAFALTLLLLVGRLAGTVDAASAPPAALTAPGAPVPASDLPRVRAVPSPPRPARAVVEAPPPPPPRPDGIIDI